MVTKVALSSGIGDNPRTLNIHVWETVSKTLKELTSNENPDNYPIWYDDGFVIFWSRGENPGIYRKRADGDGEAEMLCSASKDPLVPLLPYSLSRDGNILLIVKIIGDGFKNQDILALSLDGKRTPVPLLQEDYFETLPGLSPDGRWMAYMSNRTGRYEIYVRPFPNVAEGVRKVSTDGGHSPLWSPDGTKLFYLSGDAAMEVSVNTEEGFSCGEPKILFQKSYLGDWLTEMGSPWDIHPFGDRFLILKSPETVDQKPATEALHNFTVRMNWREKLKHEVPLN